MRFGKLNVEVYMLLKSSARFKRTEDGSYFIFLKVRMVKLICLRRMKRFEQPVLSI